MKFTLTYRIGDFEKVDTEVEGTPDDVVARYHELKEAFRAKEASAISKTDWCRFLDVYLTTGRPPDDGMGLWQDMNPEQRIVVNEIKKTLSRINRRLVKDEFQMPVDDFSGPGKGENGDYSGMD